MTDELGEQIRRKEHYCGTSMRELGKSEPGTNGHHGTVFYCPSCDQKVRRG